MIWQVDPQLLEPSLQYGALGLLGLVLLSGLGMAYLLVRGFLATLRDLVQTMRDISASLQRLDSKLETMADAEERITGRIAELTAEVRGQCRYGRRALPSGAE